MIIQLTGELHPELTCLGLKDGDIIRNAVMPDDNQKGVVHFDLIYCTHTICCSVWPDNYKIIQK
jgi:hypothetical protein